MDMEKVLTRVLEHFASNGFVFGHDWNGIVIRPDGKLQIYYPGHYGRTASYREWRDRMLFGALVIAGQVTEDQFDAWRRGEVEA